ncbi:MAG: porin family protein [Methylobacteriaceae bacterium]|nr:porin family protein [Methylobacteriaceae bacterium]
MKKLLLSSVALVGLTAGAMAADLPSRRAPAPFVAVPVFTWTGFYVGANAGYGFNAGTNNPNFGTFGAFPGSFTAPLGGYTGVVTNGVFGGRNSNDGFVGGGQVGYNYQIGNIVIGVEADAQYTDFGNNSRTNIGSVVTLTPTPPGFVGAVNSGLASGLDYYGTIRGRLGYAFDRILVYGTGGFAYGQGGRDNNAFVTANGANFGFGTGRDSFRTGWVGGGGVEYAFTPNIIGRVEGFYVSLERPRNAGFVGAVFPAVGAGVAAPTPVFINNTRRFDTEFAVVRAGISYKFNTF